MGEGREGGGEEMGKKEMEDGRDVMGDRERDETRGEGESER